MNLEQILLIVILAEVSYLTFGKITNQTIRSKKETVFIDTSALIDGRIIEIATAGFLSDKYYIPRSVVGELQQLADLADSEKRAKARIALDLITELQALDGFDVSIFQDNSFAEEGVDDRLIYLAKRFSAGIMTVDYNLNKVAKVEGVRVLNVNELSMGLRMNHLPGDKITVKLSTKGQDRGQAVGHLEDGTMVVVDNAHKSIGQSVEVSVVRSLQTAAGRMIFARTFDSPKNITKNPKQKQNNSNNSNNTVRKTDNNRKRHLVNKRSNDQTLVDLANK